MGVYTVRMDETKLFVYGTLQPGERLWTEVKASVRDAQQAILHGYKLITHYGRPFPGITMDPNKQVRGWLLSFKEGKEDILNTTDRLEGHPAVYRRTFVIVRTEDDNIPHPAWTYIYRWPHGWNDHKSERWSHAGMY